MERKKAVYFFIIFFAVIILFTYTKIFIESRQEYNKKYEFIIDNIETGAKGELTFYDSVGNEYSFASFRFDKFSKLGISVGDKVFKDYKSKDMIFSREIEDTYSVYYIQEANGMVPFSFYSY